MKPTLLIPTLLLGALAAHAGVLFQQEVSASGNSFDITDYRLADDFVVGADSTISGIGFWYQAQFPTDLSQVTYAIYADSSGGLGTLLQSESFSPTLSVGGAGNLFASFGMTSLALLANTPYWLELHAGASLTDTSGFTVSWSAADDNASAIALKDDILALPGTPVGFAGFSQYGFQLLGDPTVTSTDTPEPGTAGLLVAGLLFLAFRKRKTLALPACLLAGSFALPARQLGPLLHLSPSPGVSLDHVTVKRTNGTAVDVRADALHARDSILEGHGGGTADAATSSGGMLTSLRNHVIESNVPSLK